jgi:hypothetical protein
MLQDLAASKAFIVEPKEGKVIAIRVPLSLLPGVIGTWYLPCQKGQLPESVIPTLHADDEYQLPGFRGRFEVSWCHSGWNLLLGLERETSRGEHKYIALSHRLFHAIPRTLRLPTYFDADFTRFRPIAEAEFPLRGYPLMGPAGSGHGMEERHRDGRSILSPTSYLLHPTSYAYSDAAMAALSPADCRPTTDGHERLSLALPRPITFTATPH